MLWACHTSLTGLSTPTVSLHCHPHLRKQLKIREVKDPRKFGNLFMTSSWTFFVCLLKCNATNTFPTSHFPFSILHLYLAFHGLVLGLLLFISPASLQPTPTHSTKWLATDDLTPFVLENVKDSTAKLLTVTCTFNFSVGSLSYGTCFLHGVLHTEGNIEHSNDNG